MQLAAVCLIIVVANVGAHFGNHNGNSGGRFGGRQSNQHMVGFTQAQIKGLGPVFHGGENFRRFYLRKRKFKAFLQPEATFFRIRVDFINWRLLLEDGGPQPYGPNGPP